jgi:DNA-binding response OmpR family regulator
VLLVEDEADIARLVQQALERTGEYETWWSASGPDALSIISARRPDLVILDLSLPGLDGMDVLRLLRARAETKAIPVIMLTARAGEHDRVLGLELGADDYIGKPFSLRELTARVGAVLRRRDEAASDRVDPRGPVYRGRHLVADFDAVSIAVDGRPVQLTRREFELLRHLVANRHRVLSRDSLLEQVWGFERDVDTRSVDVHIGRLRRKLGPAGRQIETLIGLGYRFVDAEDE